MDVKNDLYHSTAILYVSLFRHTRRVVPIQSFWKPAIIYIISLRLKTYYYFISRCTLYYDYEITKTHTGDTTSFQFEEEGTISFVQKRFLFYIKYMTSISFLLLSTNKTIYLLTSLHTYNREKDANSRFSHYHDSTILKRPYHMN